MAIVVKFDVGGVDSSKYDQIIRQLDEIGEGVPDGRIYRTILTRTYFVSHTPQRQF
jgi:hypothetical protein